MENSTDTDERPIWGAKAIAAEINRPERATFYLLSTGQLPATKIGNSWVTTRGRLRQRLWGQAV